jgi:hypothetical protein
MPGGAPIRAGDREAENPEAPPCEDGLSAASTESRSRDPRPPPRTPPTSSTGEPASPKADAAPLSNASGSAPRGRDGSRLGASSARVKDYFRAYGLGKALMAEHLQPRQAGPFVLGREIVEVTEEMIEAELDRLYDLSRTRMTATWWIRCTA